VAVNARDAGAAGTTGHDVQGYKNDTKLRGDAFALGAFRFSRPEDLSASPTDGSIVAFTSTFRSRNWRSAARRGFRLLFLSQDIKVFT
jgi:secreted PhoX family phosphatase